MKASIVIIGDEILIGQTLDTNSFFLAKELDALGFQVTEIITVPDTKQGITGAMQRYISRVDIVILTGGLGPTNDDVTREVFCDFFDDYLVENATVLKHVKQLLNKVIKTPLSDVNARQALVPSKAKIFFNTVGTAPGTLMKKDNTAFISLPGVPLEMKVICQQEVFPYLKRIYNSQHMVHKTMVTYGIPESSLAKMLEQWEKNLPKGVHLAYLPSPGMVKLRLSSVGSDKESLEEKLSDVIQNIPLQVVSSIVSYQDIDISEIISKELQNRNKTISFAESCTGGRLSVLFNSQPGSSIYFKAGVVAYSTQVKIDVLGVDAQVINTYGVVSEQVVIEMARNTQKLVKSDFVIATTGNAGPTKGDLDKDLGTVFIGIATPEKVFAKKYQFVGSREMVVNNAVSKGLELIYKEIIKK
ncbi:CinA family nicotinamide mononucleotide deamidase-related protein [Myroides sp. LJL110]